MRYAPKSQLTAYLVVVLFVVVVAHLNSCSNEDDSGTGLGDNLNTELTLEGIILNPKSPGLGDTLFATAVVTSDTTFPGDYTSYKWSGNGGTFLDSTLSTVRWVAPNTSTMFSLSVTVSNQSSGSPKSASENVFVGSIVPVVDRRAGPMTMSATGDSLVFFSATKSPADQDFIGFGVSVQNLAGGGPPDVPMQPGWVMGNQTFPTILLSLSKDLRHVAYSVPTFTFGFFVQVHYLDLVNQVETLVPTTPFFATGPQYTFPNFSPDQTLLTYQMFLPDLFNTPATDSFVVAVWDIASETEKRVAVRGSSNIAKGINFYPTFSNDGNHLVYLSDPTGTGTWEYYALPVTGGTVPVDTVVTPTQITFSGGNMSSGMPPVRKSMAWSSNSTNATLAVLNNDNKLNLVRTDGSPEVLVNVASNVLAFAWSSSGQELAISTGNRIYRVDNAGAATEIITLPSGDVATRLSFSSDDRLLLYAVRRLADQWYEIWDLTNSLGLVRPLRVTPSGAAGDEAVYAGFGSLAPVWSRTDPTAYMLFFDAGDTPRICKMSFSGLSP